MGDPGDPCNPLVFGHIAKQYDGDRPRYTEVLSTLTRNKNAMTDFVAEQVHGNSLVAAAKLKWVEPGYRVCNGGRGRARRAPRRHRHGVRRRSPDRDGPTRVMPRLCHFSRQSFAESHSPGAQALTAGEMSFAATHRYGEATAKRCHSPGTPLSS